MNRAALIIATLFLAVGSALAQGVVNRQIQMNQLYNGNKSSRCQRSLPLRSALAPESSSSWMAAGTKVRQTRLVECHPGGWAVLPHRGP
jgi:hypothetical protein